MMSSKVSLAFPYTRASGTTVVSSAAPMSVRGGTGEVTERSWSSFVGTHCLFSLSLGWEVGPAMSAPQPGGQPRRQSRAGFFDVTVNGE